MERTMTSDDKVFLHTQYAIHYRRARRADLSSEARTDYGVLFVLAGKLSTEVEDQALEVQEGGALLLNPGAWANASASSAELVSLFLSPSFVMDAAVRTRLVGPRAHVIFRANTLERDERLMRLMRDLARELIEAEAGQEVVIAALIEQIVVHLLRHYTNVRRSDELELSRVGLVDRRIRRAVELMHARLDEDLPLEELAGAAYLSTFHFSRLFKKLTGATPHAYLAALRAQRAQTLLAETDLSVTQVSARVGYSSPSHFTKAFRQATGLTPRAFRAALISRRTNL